MPFTLIGKQAVRSSDGFEVRSLSRFEMQYREGGQVVTVSVEPGSFGGGESVSIPLRAFEFWDHYAVPNSEQRQAEMRENLKAGLAVLGVRLEE